MCVCVCVCVCLWYFVYVSDHTGKKLTVTKRREVYI